MLSLSSPCPFGVSKQKITTLMFIKLCLNPEIIFKVLHYCHSKCTFTQIFSHNLSQLTGNQEKEEYFVQIGFTQSLLIHCVRDRTTTVPVNVY